MQGLLNAEQLNKSPGLRKERSLPCEPVAGSPCFSSKDRDGGGGGEAEVRSAALGPCHCELSRDGPGRGGVGWGVQWESPVLGCVHTRSIRALKKKSASGVFAPSFLQKV